jgi:hypothetical protein
MTVPDSTAGRVFCIVSRATGSRESPRSLNDHKKRHFKSLDFSGTRRDSRLSI